MVLRRHFTRFKRLINLLQPVRKLVYKLIEEVSMVAYTIHP